MSLFPLLVEADPAGGVIGLRLGLNAEPSLASLSADIRRGYQREVLYENTTYVDGVRILQSPVDPTTSSRVIERIAPVLAGELPDIGRPSVVDLGRIFDGSPSLPLAYAADLVLLIARPRVDEIQSLVFAARLFSSDECRAALVLVGDQPLYPEQVADVVGLPLFAVLPDDRAVAHAFTGGSFSATRLKRSRLWRSLSHLGASTLVRPEAADADPMLRKSTRLSSQDSPPKAEQEESSPPIRPLTPSALRPAVITEAAGADQL